MSLFTKDGNKKTGTDQVDFRVMQLMCSRLCHDLVGTAGAINAAVELIDDEGGGVIDRDVADLLSRSAAESSRKLAYFRDAFGLGGNTDTQIEFPYIRAQVEGLMGGGKVSFKWNGDATTALPNTTAKLVYLMALLSFEALPRGGLVSFHIQPFSEGLGVACEAEGTGAVLRDNIVSALLGKTTVEELSSREIHAFYAHGLAQSVGAMIEFGTGESLINFAVLVPFDR